MSVEEALRTGELVEDYPRGQRALPDCLVLGFLPGDGGPVHAVVAIDADAGRILVVTVYRPDPDRWTDDWKTRH